MKVVRRLRHADVLGPGEAAHLSRGTLAPHRPPGLHDHDFHELLWVQNGRVRHHDAQGAQDLAEGALLFLRPADAHALQGRGEDALVVSVTLHPDLVAGVGARHPGLAGRLFWGEGPALRARNSRQLAELNGAALRLERRPRDALAAEGFLLPLLAGLMAEEVPLPPGAPAWLGPTLAAAREPQVFRDGAAGLVRVAGRAHPHVSRTVQRFLGESPTDHVNARRMAFAARRLAGSGDTLAEIAAEVGLPNLSHFHRLFRAAHGLSPAAFRRARQRDVLQPTPEEGSDP